MAPEAADAHNADIRGDIYSLGCVLFHALTGQVLFPDSNRVKQLVRHATEKPRPLKQFNIEVPDGLQQVMDIMLAKAPARRFPTPEKAAKALKALLTGGADVVLVENEPRMRNYLDWLESQPTPPQPATEEYRPSQIDVVLEPVASPCAEPATGAGCWPARKRTVGNAGRPGRECPGSQNGPQPPGPGHDRPGRRRRRSRHRLLFTLLVLDPQPQKTHCDRRQGRKALRCFSTLDPWVVCGALPRSPGSLCRNINGSPAATERKGPVHATYLLLSILSADSGTQPVASCFDLRPPAGRRNDAEWTYRLGRMSHIYPRWRRSVYGQLGPHHPPLGRGHGQDHGDSARP